MIVRSTTVGTEAGNKQSASITAHGPSTPPTTAHDCGTCSVPKGSDLIDLFGSTDHTLHARPPSAVHTLR